MGLIIWLLLGILGATLATIHICVPKDAEDNFLVTTLLICILVLCGPGALIAYIIYRLLKLNNLELNKKKEEDKSELLEELMK
jgi:hypothetical protein